MRSEGFYNHNHTGSDGWLVHAEPYMESKGSLKDGFAALIELCPDTYFIWVSQNGERNILSVEAFLLRMFD